MQRRAQDGVDCSSCGWAREEGSARASPRFPESKVAAAFGRARRGACDEEAWVRAPNGYVGVFSKYRSGGAAASLSLARRGEGACASEEEAARPKALQARGAVFA